MLTVTLMHDSLPSVSDSKGHCTYSASVVPRPGDYVTIAPEYPAFLVKRVDHSFAHGRDSYVFVHLETAEERGQRLAREGR